MAAVVLGYASTRTTQIAWQTGGRAGGQSLVSQRVIWPFPSYVQAAAVFLVQRPVTRFSVENDLSSNPTQIQNLEAVGMKLDRYFARPHSARHSDISNSKRGPSEREREPVEWIKFWSLS